MKTYPFTGASCNNTVGTGNYESRLSRLRNAFSRAEYVVIGAGAGLSAAAGIEYGGKRFADNFKDFISRYGFTDMYTSGFYDFKTEEERWAYWARHILVNRFDVPATGLYQLLHDTVKRKEYFVITTNVDGQFEKSGFDRRRIFAVQGDYAYMQCANGCHDRLYYDEEIIREMAHATKDCRIPSGLVPHCPVCGGKMDVHVRKNRHFVQDGQWHESHLRYLDFIEKANGGNTLLLELGVGYNTPTIIRFPFEELALQRSGVTLARVNKDYPETQADIAHFIPFGEDATKVIEGLVART